MIKKCFKKLIEKPIVFIPSILILIIGYSASYFGRPLVFSASGVNQLLILISLSLTTLLLISACLTWLLILIKPSPFKFLKATGRNFISILIIIVAYNLVHWISYFLAYGIGKLINLDVSSAKALFF